MTEERCKQIMEHLGQPNSRSLMIAIYQVANETEQEVRKKLTSDNSDYAKCTQALVDLNNEGDYWNEKGIIGLLKKHFA